MASYAEVLGHVSIDRANDLTMKTPSREPDGSRSGSTGHSETPVTSAVGPEEGLRALSDNSEYLDLRGLLWTQLVTRLQQGEPKAMEELYAMFSNGVRYYLCRQLGPEELDDRLHDAFLIVVDSIRAGELRDPRRLMGFIRTVVKRMVAATIDKQIAARREYLDEDKSSNVSDSRATPEGALLFQQQTSIVREVLQEMSERDRQILTRFYVEEQTPQVICEDMALTMTQFRLLKSRAKNRFGELGRKKLQKSGLSQVFVRISGS